MANNKDYYKILEISDEQKNFKHRNNNWIRFSNSNMLLGIYFRDSLFKIAQQ